MRSASAENGDNSQPGVLAAQRARYEQLCALESYKNDLIEVVWYMLPSPSSL